MPRVTEEWSMDFRKSVVIFFWRVRIDAFARRIARTIAPELRQDACRKLGDSRKPGDEFRNYLDGRAAQLAQPLVDDLIRKKPRIPSVMANRLVISSAAKAAAIAL